VAGESDPYFISRTLLTFLFGNIRFIAASWDLREVVAAKDEIVSKNLLVTKLAIPSNVK
jgi:hypothetical protein